jgi:hypothetical protein
MSTRDRKVTSESAHLPLSSPEDVGAIAVDTNVYKEYGFRVRSQPLVELGQVKELGIKWLVPEFWERELQRHMADNADKVTTLRRDLGKAREWADKSQLEQADRLASALTDTSGKSVASRLLEEHYGGSKPVRLPTSWDAGPQILADYFESREPFEPSGAKKSEFPDAFALATLAAWAKKNSTKVLVVTKDLGCLRACAASNVLVGSDSLTAALAALRRADEGRKAVIEEYERLLARELRSEVSELRRGIDAIIEKRVPDLELEIEFQEDGGRDCDHEVTDIRVERIDPVGYADGSLELRVFTATVGELSFVCQFQVRIEAKARFARVFRGSRTSSQLYNAPEEAADGTVDLEAIVTLQPAGALSAQTLPHANVRRVELEVRDTNIDFGPIEAWEPGYDE